MRCVGEHSETQRDTAGHSETQRDTAGHSGNYTNLITRHFFYTKDGSFSCYVYIFCTCELQLEVL